MNIMTIEIGNYKPPISDSYFIEYWYDVHQKYWVLQIFDNNDIEQECQVGIRKAGLKSEIEYYKTKYNTKDAKRI